MRNAEGVTYVEPFLKWAGGKRLLLPQLLEHIRPPARGGKYFEPFLGGGAVFFALRPEAAYLSDASPELINAYRAVQDSVEDVIRCLSRLKHSKAEYYRVRGSHPRLPATRAARFIYLNKTCFNGLYRVNLKGEFNVPFGRHPSTLLICNKKQLRNASDALTDTDIAIEDFEVAMTQAGENDVVYCDPPYTVAHTNNGFVEYNAQVFSWRDQERLAQAAASCVDRGARVYVSNASHESIRQLYTPLGFQTVEINRWSTMAGSSSKRFSSTELLLIGGQDG